MTMPVEVEYENRKKSKGVAYALWFFLGAFGGHRFYSGDTGIAVGMLLTLGGLGVWALIDAFFIGKRIEVVNQTIYAEVSRKSVDSLA